MKKLIILLIGILPFSLLAQEDFSKFTEVGFSLGLTNYSGDVAEKTIEISQNKVAYGFFIRQNFTKALSARINILSGQISGDDANSPDLAFRKIKFYSKILELGAQVEYNFLRKERSSSVGVNNSQINPYIFGGAAITLIDPKAECYGTVAECQANLKSPLPEPDLKKSLVVFPVGLGVKFDFLDRILLGLEMGWRPTFSDHLDGVKINGNPDKNDWYIFGGVTASYILFDSGEKGDL